VSLVRLEHFFVALNTGISVLLITVELKLETTVKQFDLLNQLVLHALKLFDVLVFRLLSCRFKRCLHLPELECFFFLDRFNKFTQLRSLIVMATGNLCLFGVVLSFDNVHVTLKLLVQTGKSSLLEFD
jgi:hypothetical protein